MKKVVFILSSIALVACGAPEEVGTTDELKAKKQGQKDEGKFHNSCPIAESFFMQFQSH